MAQDNEKPVDTTKTEDKAAPGAERNASEGAKGSDKPSVPGDKKPGFGSK